MHPTAQLFFNTWGKSVNIFFQTLCNDKMLREVHSSFIKEKLALKKESIA